MSNPLGGYLNPDIAEPSGPVYVTWFNSTILALPWTNSANTVLRWTTS